jgi:hypothetical protein
VVGQLHLEKHSSQRHSEHPKGARNLAIVP